MTDITERLRSLYTDNGTNHVQEAADTIDTLRNERDVLQDAFVSRGITIEVLRQRVKESEDYLREVAVEAGLPHETLDIATCRHIAHQVKYIRNAAVQYMDELAALKQHGEPIAWLYRDYGNLRVCQHFPPPSDAFPVYTAPPAQHDGQMTLQEFDDWLCREMPPNTVINNPKWWAPHIYKLLVG